jgi:hypothetical protein
VVAAMQHRGPPSGLGDATSKPPLQKAMSLMVSGRTRAPLPATARGSGTLETEAG